MLEDVDWTIREGERWQLSGANGSRDRSLVLLKVQLISRHSGSGKTTLLSVLTGDHPQSYNQSSLTLFGVPRRRLATAQIQAQMGIVSPEIFNAFPRRSGAHSALSARDAIGTGFESTFSFRSRSAEQEADIDALLAYFDAVLSVPLPGVGRGADGSDKFDAGRPFGTLPIGHQALILLLRAFAGSPRLIVLDEVFSGMDDKMVGLAKQYLREELTEKQAVIFVSHWTEEVPWQGEELKRLHLGD